MQLSDAKDLQALVYYFINLSLEETNYWCSCSLRQRQIKWRVGTKDQRIVKYLFFLNKIQIDNTIVYETPEQSIYPAIYIYPEFKQAFVAYGLGSAIEGGYDKFSIFDNLPTIQNFFDEKNPEITPKILRTATKYDYLHNKYTHTYSLEKVDTLNPTHAISRNIDDMCFELDRYFKDVKFRDYFKEI